MEIAIYILFAVIQAILAARYIIEPEDERDGPVTTTILFVIFAPLVTIFLVVWAIRIAIIKLVVKK